MISECTPFLPPHEIQPSDLIPSVDLSTTCPIFLEKGGCKHGLKCRFLGGHIRHTDSGSEDIAALAIARDETLSESRVRETAETNAIDQGVLKQLRSRKVSATDITFNDQMLIHESQYPTPLADAYLLELESRIAQQGNNPTSAETSLPLPLGSDISTANDTPDVPSRPSEKKRLHWTGQTCKWLRQCVLIDWNQ